MNSLQQIEQPSNPQVQHQVDNLKVEISETTTPHEVPTMNEEQKCIRSPSIETPREIIEQSENNNLLLLVDWDDTLFPSTFMIELLKSKDASGFVPVSNEHILLLNQLGELTLKLLCQLIEKYGSEHIHIVSNSVDGWIKESLCLAANISETYKRIDLLLTENNITMDSAQTMYAQNNSLKKSSPVLWKQFCFAVIINKSPTKSYSHILSIGDQWTDHYTVKNMIKSLNINCSIHHIIKLKSIPNVNDMINEMLYIQTVFDRIFYSIGPQSVQPIVVDYHMEEINH